MPLSSVRLVLLATAALLLTPTAASAAWTVTPTPTPNISATVKVLNGVDCSSAKSCIAVGSADTHFAGTPIVEHWDGTSWQLMPTPQPIGSLNGISCPRANFCFAVGAAGRGVIERWDGTSWSIEPGTPDTPAGSLNDVSCSGVLACTAVGSVATGTVGPTGPNTRPLAERWDATGWHLQSTPTPTGSDTSQLSSVSCPLKRTCTAVGQSSSSGVRSPLVERWFGRVNAWGQQAAPQPEDAESVGLGQVSCPHGSRICVVAGSSNPAQGQSSVMAARRIGLGNWSIFPLIALPASSLSAVDCPATQFCQATGKWGNGLIAERFDGTSWHVQGIPTPGVSFPRMADVSCPSRFFCMAVGIGFDPTFLADGFTLAAKWTP